MSDFQSFPPEVPAGRMVEQFMEAAGIEPANFVLPNHPQAGLSWEVGFRLASLADGEGHFAVGRSKNRHGNMVYRCSFGVKMRADDRAFLERFARETELGMVREASVSLADGHDRKPQVEWKIWGKTECLALTMIFDHYPLWSKKARDFAIWRRAVIEWCDHEPGDDWLPMSEFYTSLQEVRVFAQEAS